MAAPILWAPRISAFFLQENLHVHKILVLRGVGGGILVFWGGGGSADFTFSQNAYYRGDVPHQILQYKPRIAVVQPLSCGSYVSAHNTDCSPSTLSLEIITMRPEMITQIIRKQFFCVKNVRAIRKLIPRQLMCVVNTSTESTL